MPSCPVSSGWRRRRRRSSADLREVYAEAKGTGFDVKALRNVISLRKLDETKRREEERCSTTYLHALGMTEAWKRTKSPEAALTD